MLHYLLNLVQIIYMKSSMNINHFVFARQQIWPPWPILVSDWLKLKKYLFLFFLKMQMICYLVQMLFTNSSTNRPHFTVIVHSKWLTCEILVFEWMIFVIWYKRCLSGLLKIFPIASCSVKNSFQISILNSLQLQNVFANQVSGKKAYFYISTMYGFLMMYDS